ncbi:MAG: hypothetical protein DME22_12685 [Verrucomicrobia bacterium]|nr:MAG: hypothetical protein DME22_12685 [Verrucomicrobiota bacterium]
MGQFCQDRFIPFQNAEQFSDSQVWNLRPQVAQMSFRERQESSRICRLQAVLAAEKTARVWTSSPLPLETSFEDMTYDTVNL